MTQITRKSVPMRGLILLLAMFLGAGLVLSGCGDDDTATTPAPAPPPPPPPAPEPEPEPEPEPPAPTAPATPTGLHVDDTTETSVEYHWNAVEGAIGYAVQVSMDEMFGADDQIIPTAETHIEIGPLPPMTTVYVRVAAAAGTLEAPVLSDWSTHVTGMTAMPPPPPPPPPAPALMVTFSLPMGQTQMMMADKDDDEATAMASVNSKIMVESNSSAVITPMFVEGANGVSVSMGSNMPFGLVNWSMLQSAVLSDGATFMAQRTMLGANQQMEPTGDMVYITCGPFECMEGEDPPEISIAHSAACQGWDPELDLQVGRIDNDVINPGTGDPDIANDGVDLGMVFKSSLAMKVKHSWSGVAHGRNTSSTVDVAKSSTGATMPMKQVMDITLTDDAGTPDDASDDPTDGVCETYAAATSASSLFEPAGCFRALGPGPADDAANYLSGWSIELQPQGAGVTWGRVDWDDDPFEDLKCESMTMMVGDMVETDVCDMFEEEVDYAVGDSDDWTPTVIFNSDNQVIRWQATAKRSADDTATPSSTTGKFFKTLWFDDNLNNKIKGDSKADRSATGVTGVAALHDLYNQNGDDGNLEWIWGSLTDVDGDPIAGDLGKVDMASPDNADTDVDESDETDALVHPDGIADNYPSGSTFEASVRTCTEADGGDDDDGTKCDANWSMDVDVLFADGTFGCSTTRSVTVKCTWDADGGITTGRGVTLPTAASDFDGDGNLANFLKCEAE